MQLDNNILMGKQEHPRDVLAAKRLMTGFVPATGVVKHKRQESGPSDVAFMERKDEGGGGHHTCYCCGEHHHGGYRKCPDVTKAVQEQTIKAVDAGHFRQK